MTCSKTAQTPATAKNKNDTGSSFSQISDSGSERTIQNLWPPLMWRCVRDLKKTNLVILHGETHC